MAALCDMPLPLCSHRYAAGAAIQHEVCSRERLQATGALSLRMCGASGVSASDAQPAAHSHVLQRCRAQPACGCVLLKCYSQCADVHVRQHGEPKNARGQMTAAVLLSTAARSTALCTPWPKCRQARQGAARCRPHPYGAAGTVPGRCLIMSSAAQRGS